MSWTRRLFYTGSCLFELTKGIILLSVTVVLIHLFVATIFIVDGVSMEPNLHSGQVILVNRWAYLFGEPLRGDITVLRFPGDPEHRKYVKRVIGLPGEMIELDRGTLLVNSELLEEPYLPRNLSTPVMIPGKTTWVMGDDDYFLVGDNRPNSNDSRTWDEASQRFLIGRAVLILWPPKDLGLIPPAYEVPLPTS